MSFFLFIEMEFDYNERLLHQKSLIVDHGQSYSIKDFLGN
jgi:hypothetical protein